MKLGVVVIARNVEPWIEQALRSVRDQTCPLDHVVVVENGSSDATRATIEAALHSYGESLPATLLSEPPLGANGARNLGAEHVLRRGVDAIAFLDGDDWWAPRFLELVARTLSASARRAAAFGWVTIRDVDGAWLGMRPRFRRDYDYEALCWVRSPMVTASALMIRSRDFLRVDGFDIDLPAAQDWEICLRLTEGGKSLGCARRGVVNYRKRPGQVTRDAATSLAGHLAVERRHPVARRGKHWWWLLNLALYSGAPDLVARVRERFPPVRPTDLLSPQFLKHLGLRARRALVASRGERVSGGEDG